MLMWINVDTEGVFIPFRYVRVRQIWGNNQYP